MQPNGHRLLYKECFSVRSTPTSSLPECVPVSQALDAVQELLGTGQLRDSEAEDVWKSVAKAGSGDRVNFQGFYQAFARVASLFEDEEEEEEGTGGVRVDGEGVRTTVNGDKEEEEGVGGTVEKSFVQLVGSKENFLDLEGLLRCVFFVVWLTVLLLSLLWGLALLVAVVVVVVKIRTIMTTTIP